MQVCRFVSVRLLHGVAFELINAPLSVYVSVVSCDDIVERTELHSEPICPAVIILCFTSHLSPACVRAGTALDGCAATNPIAKNVTQ